MPIAFAQRDHPGCYSPHHHLSHFLTCVMCRYAPVIGIGQCAIVNRLRLSTFDGCRLSAVDDVQSIRDGTTSLASRSLMHTTASVDEAASSHDVTVSRSCPARPAVAGHHNRHLISSIRSQSTSSA